MLSNLHTHTLFCDGKSSAEEVVLSAIKKGFSSIGFSGHGYTNFDLTYCMKDMDAYIKEILRLKEKYKKDIQIYLGIEEDAFSPVDRTPFDYILGSSHYLHIGDNYYPVDSGYEGLKKCIDMFDGDIIKLADSYYSNFCEYIKNHKPDIIGHFDLITKFDELDESLFFANDEYNKLAEKYIAIAAQSGCMFEVNTGAISRGVRTTPYPKDNLLRILKKQRAKIVLNSDSHHADTLDFAFDEAKLLLKDIGFEYTYILYNNEFKKDLL